MALFLNNSKMKLEQQIQEWKEKFGGIYKLPVEDKAAYLREPEMADYKRAFAAMNKGGDIGFGEEMLNSLMVGGDAEIKTDLEYFTPARKALLDFFKYDDAEETPIENNKTKITISGNTCVLRIITREDLKTADRKNPAGKPFVTQEKLFEAICVEKDEVFNNKNNAAIRMPLYKAIEDLQNKKVAWLEKL